MLPAWVAGRPEVSQGEHRAEPIYGTTVASPQAQDRAEAVPGAGSAGRSPEAALQPGRECRGLGRPLQAVLPVQDLRRHFPVRDLGPGEAGFLLRHCDVTTRVGTGPRKTSSCTGPTLVQDTGAELSAVP